MLCSLDTESIIKLTINKKNKCMFCQCHPVWFITLLILVKSTNYMCPLLCKFFQSAVTFSHLGINIVISAMFSNIVNLYYSSHVTDQIWHPYKTKDKIIILYILICMVLDKSHKDKHFKHSVDEHSMHLIYS